MKNLTKAMVGTVAAGALAVSTASPALARDHNDGIGAGEVIAGALIIGGIAAVAVSANNRDRYRDDYRYSRDYRYDRNSRYDRRGYGYNSNPSQAVEQCVRAAESNASRYTRGRADVTQIRDVDRKRDGYDVEGRIVVEEQGWNRRYRNDYDTGKFKCKVRYGRVADLDYSGIRGLR